MKKYRASAPLPAQCSRQVGSGSRLNFQTGRRHSGTGFTLVELLTVIAIIAILAAMLLPALSAAKTAAKKNKAKVEMSGLVQAIVAYDNAYGRYPLSLAAQTAAASTNGDYTYGGMFNTPTSGVIPIGTPTPSGTSVLSNSEVVAILMDITNFPNNPLQWTANTNHIKNPQQTKFLNPTVVSDPTLPGVGPDLVYRDPWGNPYVITMDANFDGQCNDAFYGQKGMSQNSGATGYYGLFNNVDSGGGGNNFQFHGQVMVWSAGPDGKIDPKVNAITGANKDNIISWQ